MHAHFRGPCRSTRMCAVTVFIISAKVDEYVLFTIAARVREYMLCVLNESTNICEHINGVSTFRVLNEYVPPTNISTNICEYINAVWAFCVLNEHVINEHINHLCEHINDIWTFCVLNEHINGHVQAHVHDSRRSIRMCTVTVSTTFATKATRIFSRRRSGTADKSKETYTYKKRPTKQTQISKDLLTLSRRSGTADKSKETCTYEKRPTKET